MTNMNRFEKTKFWSIKLDKFNAIPHENCGGSFKTIEYHMYGSGKGEEGIYSTANLHSQRCDKCGQERKLLTDVADYIRVKYMPKKNQPIIREDWEKEYEKFYKSHLIGEAKFGDLCYQDHKSFFTSILAKERGKIGQEMYKICEEKLRKEKEKWIEEGMNKMAGKIKKIINKEKNRREIWKKEFKEKWVEKIESYVRMTLFFVKSHPDCDIKKVEKNFIKTLKKITPLK